MFCQPEAVHLDYRFIASWRPFKIRRDALLGDLSTRWRRRIRPHANKICVDRRRMPGGGHAIGHSQRMDHWRGLEVESPFNRRECGATLKSRIAELRNFLTAKG